MAGKKSATEKKVYTIGGEEVTELKQITLPMIKNHVMQLGDKDIQWLIDTIETKIEAKDKKTKETIIGEDGKPIMRKPTYIDIRNAFADEYFPDLAPKRTTQKADKLKDTLAELKAALENK